MVSLKTTSDKFSDSSQKRFKLTSSHVLLLWRINNQKVKKENKSKSSNSLSHTSDKVIKLWVKNLPILFY